MSKYDVYRRQIRQIVTSKVGPRAARVEGERLEIVATAI